MLKDVPGIIARKQHDSAVLACAIDGPSIDPEQSIRKTTSRSPVAGLAGTLSNRGRSDTAA